MSRRHVIAVGAAAVAGVAALLWPVFEKRKANSPKVSPRFRYKKTPAVFSQVKREEGFYVRLPDRTPNSRRDSNARNAKSVIHYVDAKKRIPFVAEINEDKLRPATPEEIAFSSTSTHVHFSRASASFELAALEQLSKQRYTEACRLLVEGIKHDLAFKRTILRGPSLRLFDLLALIAVRQGQQQYLQTLLDLAGEAFKLVESQDVNMPARRKPRPGASATPPPMETVNFDEFRQKRKDAFTARIEKWKGATWQQHVKDPLTKVIWKATLAPDTKKGKNERREFEIASVAPRANANTPS